MQTMKPEYTVHEGRRYRLKFRNASDDVPPQFRAGTRRR